MSYDRLFLLLFGISSWYFQRLKKMWSAKAAQRVVRTVRGARYTTLIWGTDRSVSVEYLMFDFCHSLPRGGASLCV